MIHLHRTRTIVCVLLFAVLIAPGCVGTSSTGTPSATSPTTDPTATASSSPEDQSVTDFEMAPFLGKWRGDWESGVFSSSADSSFTELIVEMVSGKPFVTYTYGGDRGRVARQYTPPETWRNPAPQFIKKDGVVYMEFSRFQFHMLGKELYGKIKSPGWNAYCILKKIGEPTSTATPTRPTTAIPLPQDMHIVQPAPDLPTEIKAFSGKWFGIWDGVLEHILVVEQINPPNVTAIYAYGKAPSWKIDKPNFVRVQGTIEGETLKLFLRRPATVYYRIQSDGTLDATYEYSDGVAHATMRRLNE